MSTTYSNFAHGEIHSPRPRKSAPRISNQVLGMSMFVATELMFFVALISAYLVIRAGTGNWVPPEAVRLPVMATGLNTAILLASGALMWRAGKLLVQGKPRRADARRTYLQAVSLGAFFVAFQGYEWVKLISLGMTMHSGLFGACFFLLIGSHGLHALVTIIAMSWYYYRHIRNGTMTIGGFRALQLFWFFVVGMWPLLYGLVYF